ncbi:MAG TPA: hypothetical protein VN137_00730, partial [Sphingomonas sp.]|nr:hypothetical protein [Sphingomonas sp.]
TLTLEPDGCRLSLPVRAAPAVEAPMPIKVVPVPPDSGDVTVRTTNEGGTITMIGTWPDRSRQCANGTTLSGYGPNTVATIKHGAPDTASWTGERISRYRRGDWDCRLRCTFSVRAAPGGIAIEERIEAFRGETSIFDRAHSVVLPA